MEGPKRSEGFSYGPFKVERQGRFVQMSVSDKDQHREFMENIEEQVKQIHELVAKNVEEIREIILEYDQFILLANVALMNTTTDISKLTESQMGGREGLIEYAQSIITSIDQGKSTKPSLDIINRFKDMISANYDLVERYYFGETSKENNIENEIRFLSLMTYLNIRGDSYPMHHIELFKDLFSPHDKKLLESYGFNSTDFILFINEVNQNLSNNIYNYVIDNPILKNIRDKYHEKVISNKVSENDFYNLNEVIELFSKMRQFPRGLFELVPSITIKKEISEALSARACQKNYWYRLYSSPTNKKTYLEIH